jgi:hypothetical protein
MFFVKNWHQVEIFVDSSKLFHIGTLLFKNVMMRRRMTVAFFSVLCVVAAAATIHDDDDDKFKKFLVGIGSADMYGLAHRKRVLLVIERFFSAL